ncbi:MAG TPA: chromate transporter [Stellaceae bacterium]|nr:chromate transporter [Stellaceae bacterium]
MSLVQLLLVIFTYNLLTFGNGAAVLALLQHRLVQDAGVLNLDQFLYAYALGRITPGQNNLYLASIGYMIYGWLGALAAIVAIQVPGYLVLPVLKGYERVRHQRSVQGFIRGLTAASVGLMFSVAFNISREALTGLVPWIVFLSTLALVFLAKRGLLLGMVGAAGLGLGLKLILSIS